MILVILLSMTLPTYPTVTVDEAMAAIVETGHGNELFWYTPRVEYYLPHSVPSTVRGATNCWPPVYSGVVYINPRFPKSSQSVTIAHEMTHLQTDCNNTELDAELSAMDALAYLGRDADVIRNVIERMDGCIHPPRHLSNDIVKRYYCDVAYTILYTNVHGDTTNKYPYLYEVMVDIGVLPDAVYDSRR